MEANFVKWVAAATSYESMLGGRIIQGIGSTFFEGPAYGVIGDLYFVHQRGSRMALFNTAQSGILLLPSLIAGVVAKNLGWRWVFWIMVVVVGMATASSVLIGWETMFDRNALYNIDASSIDVRY